MSVDFPKDAALCQRFLSARAQLVSGPGVNAAGLRTQGRQLAPGVALLLRAQSNRRLRPSSRHSAARHRSPDLDAHYCPRRKRTGPRRRCSTADELRRLLPSSKERRLIKLTSPATPNRARFFRKSLMIFLLDSRKCFNCPPASMLTIVFRVLESRAPKAAAMVDPPT